MWEHKELFILPHKTLIHMVMSDKSGQQSETRTEHFSCPEMLLSMAWKVLPLYFFIRCHLNEQLHIGLYEVDYVIIHFEISEHLLYYFISSTIFTDL